MRRYEEALLADFLAVNVLHKLFEQGRLSSLDAESRQLSPVAETVLNRAGVIDAMGQFTHEFKSLIGVREKAFLERLKFTRAAGLDVIEHIEDLLDRPDLFVQKSRAFSIFDYGAGFSEGRIAHATTENWCNYVAALSELEGPPLSMEISDLLKPKFPEDIFEIGGNIGAFAYHLQTALGCRRYRIFDIPQVCCLGREYSKKNNAKFEFIAGDMHEADWVTVFGKQHPDCILFKSVLHDWPIEHVRSLLTQLLHVLTPGTKLVIVERGAFSSENLGPAAFSDAANVIFSQFYREISAYRNVILDIHPTAEVRMSSLELDMKWHVLVAEIVE